MDIQNKRARLKELLEQNIRNEKIGTAIAITGSWGIGKTYFWNKFLESQLSEERIYKKDNVFNRKYAYVSLFGLESLSDLKTQIYSSIESHHSTVEIPKWIKGLPSIFKDTKISQFGISAPAKLFDNLMFSQVKDAIICFDDFERMSKKLDIKDVMGLANQLKLEKNCQILLILDESKNEGENKSKYAEYKEKLIDEEIKINSVEPLIRENTKDIDESLVNLMVKFADELEIHNFRFFQKVIKLYRQFLEQLPDQIAYSTKEIILIRILQGYFIEDFGGKYEFTWNDLKLSGFDDSRDDWTENKKRVFNKIEDVMPFYFLRIDNWFFEFKSWFSQEKDFDDNLIQELVTSELLDEKYQQAKENIERLIQQYKAFDINWMFSKHLACEIKKIIKFETLENIEFYCSILSEFNEIDQIADIDRLVQVYLQSEFASNRAKLLERYYWHENKNNKFRKYIKGFLDDSTYFRQDDFVSIIRLFLDKGEVAYGTKEIFMHLTKEHLQKFILEEYLKNFKKAPLKAIIEVILDLYTNLNLENQRQIVQIWIKEILEEHGQKKGFPDHYVKYFTENL